MVRSTISYLLVSAGALEQKYTIANTDHPSQCVYCHPDGESQLYGCDTGYDDQKFYLQKVPESDVGGRSNGYLIKSADSGLCLASNWAKAANQLEVTKSPKIFGWSDCSTSDGNVDRSWIFSLEDDGMKIENAHYPGTCMSTDNGWRFFRYPCGSGGQRWRFDPPFNPHGTSFTNADGYWKSITSGNNDFTYTFTTGMQFSHGTEVSHSDQIGLSAQMQLSGKFLGMGGEETVGASYKHSWSKTVTDSRTDTEKQSCAIGCEMKNLPAGYSGAQLMQWRLEGTSSSTKDVLTTLTCNYWCLPIGLSMKCPVDCCHDVLCQTCVSGCVLSSNDTLMVV